MLRKNKLKITIVKKNDSLNDVNKKNLKNKRGKLQKSLSEFISNLLKRKKKKLEPPHFGQKHSSNNN